jgi:predicted nucleotide-binding protein
MADTRPKVFLGSSGESYDILRVLKEKLQDIAQIVTWRDPSVFPSGQFTLESLLKLAPQYDFAILVLGRDDLVTSRGKTLEAPRDNVVFELGLFMSRLERFRTFALRPAGIGEYKVLSDLSGLNLLEYEEATGKAKRITTEKQRSARLNYLRGALEGAVKEIRHRISLEGARRTMAQVEYLGPHGVQDVRETLFKLIRFLGDDSHTVTVDNLSHDLGLTWPMMRNNVFAADSGIRNLRLRTLMVDPQAPAIQKAAGAGFSVQEAKIKAKEITDTLGTIRSDLRARHIESELRAYSSVNILHGFLIDNRYLLLGLAEQRLDGKLGTHKNPYWMYERNPKDASFSQPVDVFQSLFEYLWTKSRKICEVS